VRFRLFAPLLPVVYASLCASASALINAVRLERPPPRYVTDGAIVLAAGALMLFTLQSSSTDPAVPLERDAVDDRVAIGRWLRDTMPQNTSIAVIPAGAIPYESQLVTIDMLGINDEHIAHRDLPLGEFGAGHEKYDTEYVLDRRPDIILLVDALDAAPRERADYSGLMGGIILARIDMLSTPRLWEEYQARSVEIAEGKWLNLLARNGASEVLARTRAP
jgi:hypothetical protein